LFFETGSLYVTQAGLMFLLPQSPKCWDYSHTLPLPASKATFFGGGWYWGLNLGLCVLPLELCFQPFLLWLFWKYSLAFCPGGPGSRAFYFRLPVIIGMTGMHYHSQFYFSIEMGSCELFCLSCSGTTILQSQPPE
jgi:hypothetical protein